MLWGEKRKRQETARTHFAEMRREILTEEKREKQPWSVLGQLTKRVSTIKRGTRSIEWLLATWLENAMHKLTSKRPATHHANHLPMSHIPEWSNSQDYDHQQVFLLIIIIIIIIIFFDKESSILLLLLSSLLYQPSPQWQYYGGTKPAPQ